MDDAMETVRNSDGNTHFDGCLLDRLENQKSVHHVGECGGLLLDSCQLHLDAGRVFQMELPPFFSCLFYFRCLGYVSFHGQTIT